MPTCSATLHLLCGKIASGKSTLAQKLSAQENTVMISEDEWLDALFADQLDTIDDYMRCASKLRDIFAPHIIALLDAGMSVVLDFQANTVESRAWMRGILKQTNASHRMHVLAAPDVLCLARLERRNARGNHAFSVSETQFRVLSKHFSPPTEDEGFCIVTHVQGE